MRVAVCGLLTLLSSRWLLHAMGEVDYGLYFVIWGAVGMMAFFSTAMVMSAQRHFAFAIGQGEIGKVNSWFNASVAVHLVLGVLLVVSGLIAGHWLINSVLVIPDERISVCYKVFICLLVTVFLRVLAAPCLGFLAAKQRIHEVAGWQVLQTFALFVFSYFLSSVPFDKLLSYSVYMAFVTVFITFLQCIRCAISFEECRLKPVFSLADCIDLLKFGGWNLFGTLAGIGSRQGTAFVINIFSGAVVNTSYGISYQVGDAGEGVAVGLSNALLPEITSAEGRGDRDRVISLSLLSSKFSVLLFCILLIPMGGEMNDILRLWLKEVPPYAGSLCLIVLSSLLIDKLTIGYVAALLANGKIAGYQVSLGMIGLLAPLIAVLMLNRGYSVPWSIGVALLLPRAICAIGRLYWVKRLMDVPVKCWFSDVLLRCLGVLILPVIAVFLIRYSSVSVIWRIFSSFLMCGILLALSAWFVGFTSEEKFYLREKVAGLRRRWLA